jgi:hypothetical protein
VSAELKLVAFAIHQRLKPRGFAKRGLAWSRTTPDWIDVIDLEVGKSRDIFTVNLGVVDPTVFERCWNQPVPRFARVEDCTVYTRLSELITGRHRWLDVADLDSARDIPQLLETHGVPFLERLHSHEAMADELSKGLSGLLPAEAFSLALIRARLGQIDTACAVLQDRRPRIPGIWADRFQLLHDELHCPS